MQNVISKRDERKRETGKEGGKMKNKRKGTQKEPNVWPARGCAQRPHGTPSALSMRQRTDKTPMMRAKDHQQSSEDPNAQKWNPKYGRLSKSIRSRGRREKTTKHHASPKRRTEEQSKKGTPVGEARDSKWSPTHGTSWSPIRCAPPPRTW